MFTYNSKDSFIVVSDVGQVIGTRGETAVKIALTDEGFMITAHPVKLS
jgi:hypothetical protein